MTTPLADETSRYTEGFKKATVDNASTALFNGDSLQYKETEQCTASASQHINELT